VWSRAPYPDGLRDDGLAGGMERFRTPAAAATELAGYLDEDIPLERITELLEHAERETLSQGVLETFGSEFAWDDSDPHAMTEALGRSGLDGRMG
jgi:hypothetical protein